MDQSVLQQVLAELTGGVTLAGLAVIVVEWIKKSPKFTWFTEQSAKWIKVGFGAIAAGLASVGIVVEWHPEVGELLVKGLFLTSVLTALVTAALTFVKQWVWQELLYRVIQKKTNGITAVKILG